MVVRAQSQFQLEIMGLASLPITLSESLIVSGEQILPDLALEAERALVYQLPEEMQIFTAEISSSGQSWELVRNLF
jgi:hypothetical protein